MCLTLAELKSGCFKQGVTCGPIFDEVLPLGAAICPQHRVTEEGRLATIRAAGTFSEKLYHVFLHLHHAEAARIFLAEASVVAYSYQVRGTGNRERAESANDANVLVGDELGSAV